MSLVKWFKSLFGAAPKRDVSRLAPTPGATTPSHDIVEERVDVSGGPLKEHHRRRALRDKRLLPKVASQVQQLGFGKRKVMSADEAGRLFAGTLRTRNRNLRDLTTDEEQLKRHGLPVWKTETDLASALKVSVKQLRYFSIHRERERQPHYVTFAIPKRSGGKRMIMAPKRRLKMIQRILLETLVEKLPVSEHAHAFRRGRNIRTGAEPHLGRTFVLKMDLKDFFPSVTAARVRGLLIAYGYSYPIATTLAVLMTESERQPVEVDGKLFYVPVGLRHCVQGAPTSPALCNALVLRLDHRLSGLAKKHNLTFTRYADDLSFSGELNRASANRLRAVITRIVEEEGFKVNTGKTRYMGKGARQVVTGVVVNEILGLSRRERRRLRARAHQLKLHPSAAGTEEKLLRLRGKLAYLSMLNPDQASKINVPSS